MFHVKQKRVAFRCSAGACLLCRLPTLLFVYLSAPIPPTPFPAGRGRFFVLFCRGLAPPAPLRLSPDGIGFFCRISAFLPPSPLPPFPAGRGRPRLFYARGSAPCIPGAEPARHWLNRGLAPPAPLLLNLRGAGSVGAGAPGTPATEPARRWLAGRLRPLHPRG